MSFSLHKSWDNGRDERGLRRPMNDKGRTWTRRVQWLQGDDKVKLKFWDGDDYREVIFTSDCLAQTAYNRFRDGQSINDAISILGTEPPPALQSRKTAKQKKEGM